jgi:hypothetical protein
MYSIIICSVDDNRFASISQNIQQRLGKTPHEIIRIPDARSIAEGYMRGISQSAGDRLILCHDDIEILNPDFAERLDEHFRRYDLIGVAGANRIINAGWIGAGPPWIFGQIVEPFPSGGLVVAQYAVPLSAVPGIKVMDGLFLACRREVTQRIGFDAATFDGFSLYDLDFTFSAHLAGFKLAVATDIHIFHQSAGKFDQTWEGYVGKFLAKYAGQLDHGPEQKFSYAGIFVATKEEASRVMKATSEAVRANSSSLTPPVRLD